MHYPSLGIIGDHRFPGLVRSVPHARFHAHLQGLIDPLSTLVRVVFRARAIWLTVSLDRYRHRIILLPEKVDRLVSGYRRPSDGLLKEEPRTQPPPKDLQRRRCLYSTAGDYVRFMQTILPRGRGMGTQQILRPETVDSMASNQIGELSAGKMTSTSIPGLPADSDSAFLINKTAYGRGRSAGSLAWAGLENSFYWIDPMGALHDFECAVYANVPARISTPASNRDAIRK